MAPESQDDDEEGDDGEESSGDYDDESMSWVDDPSADQNTPQAQARFGQAFVGGYNSRE